MAESGHWHEGDRSEALCPACWAWRATEFQYRESRLKKSNKDVPDVLVAVCTVCDSIVAIPHQAVPMLRDALDTSAPEAM